MSDYVLAIDQGTTGSTALVIDFAQNAKVIGRCNVEFKQHFPKPGWVEHDLDEIWGSVGQAITRALAEARSSDRNFRDNSLRAIGITNQRETLCVYERGTGRALRKAIVWQCRRTADMCQGLKEKGWESKIRQATGLLLDPYFSGTKLSWVMEDDAALRRRAEKGEVLFSTIEAFLLYRLTGCERFATEASNASRTLLFDINEGRYSDELLDLFRCPNKAALPEVLDSVGDFGETKGLDFLPDGIPITGVLGDQQAALAGQSCFDEGEAKCTYGTGAFLLLNTGKTNPRSRANLLTTISWQLKGELYYSLEGAAFVAGAAVQFVRDQLGFIKSARESEALATKAAAAPDIYFVPALAGLGAPYWDPHARGAFFGLTRGSDRGQLIRAAIESIAFQVCDLLDAMAQDAKSGIKVLMVDGGACENNLLMQLQADLTGLKIDRPKNLETTALGAAMFAALGCGIYRDLTDLSKVRMPDRVFEPDKSFQTKRRQYLSGWQRAVGATRYFSGSLKV